jgi:alcohol dehydrogenase class IV
MRFEFATATRIIFGRGCVEGVGAVARECGSKALVVTGKNPGRAEGLLKLLRAAGMATATFPIAGEPELEDVRRGVALAKDADCDVVMGFGGGSALDAGKAIAAMMTNTGDVSDYVEIIGRGRTLGAASAPFIAIPTTAGTGSEVTRNAVLASPEHRLKVSLRSPLMLPLVAVVDPKLTVDLPAALTASTGLDAMTQLIEPFVCSRANPMTDAICREGLRRAGRSLRRAFANGGDIEARDDMSLAALFGGMALANAGLGAVHGFAGPIGGMFDAPHGAICAVLLPCVMAANVRALREREPGAAALAKLGEVAELLTGTSGATVEQGIDWLRSLVADLKIPRLGAYGIAKSDAGEIASRAENASSMKANPVRLSREELEGILELAN